MSAFDEGLCQGSCTRSGHAVLCKLQLCTGLPLDWRPLQYKGRHSGSHNWHTGEDSRALGGLTTNPQWLVTLTVNTNKMSESNSWGGEGGGIGSEKRGWESEIGKRRVNL